MTSSGALPVMAQYAGFTYTMVGPGAARSAVVIHADERVCSKAASSTGASLTRSPRTRSWGIEADTLPSWPISHGGSELL